MTLIAPKNKPNSSYYLCYELPRVKVATTLLWGAWRRTDLRWEQVNKHTSRDEQLLGDEERASVSQEEEKRASIRREMSVPQS